MSISGESITKEVRSCCKCIVKEKPCKNVPKPEPVQPTSRSSNQQNDTCKATFVGQITLPANCCCCKGAAADDNKDIVTPVVDPGQNDNCAEVYRDLGGCLRNCIVEQYNKNRK